MVRAFAALGFACLCVAFAGLQLSTFVLDMQCGTGTGTVTSAEVPLLHSAVAAVVALFVAVALTYRHLMNTHVAAAVAGAGNGRRSISRHVMFALCVSAGTLEFIVFGQADGGWGDGAIGLFALCALPALATGTFFLGMVLIIVAHVRAGGEGGGTGAVAGDGMIQGLLLVLLTKVAAGMAAVLVAVMVTALTFHGAK